MRGILSFIVGPNSEASRNDGLPAPPLLRLDPKRNPTRQSFADFTQYDVAEHCEKGFMESAIGQIVARLLL
jgi:hypothetical protein